MSGGGGGGTRHVLTRSVGCGEGEHVTSTKARWLPWTGGTAAAIMVQ